jgi:glucose dehydrogenase
MSQVKYLVKRPAVASVTLLVAASLAAGGCGSSGNPSTAGCSSKPVQPAASGAAAGWTLPGGDLRNTRAVVGPITSSNVSQLGVAWCVPLESTGAIRAAGLSNGYATTPVVVNGVVYTQDLESNVMAIIAYELGAKGKLPDTMG